MFNALPEQQGKTKLVGPSGSKLAVSAQRPTFEASPALLMNARLAVLRPTARQRNLLEMIKQARDFNPDVALALDNIVTLAIPPYTIKVYQPRAKGAADDTEPTIDTEGQRLVEMFAQRMFSEYSGTSVWDNTGGQKGEYPGLTALQKMAVLMAATTGGAAAEVELTEALDDIVDVYPVEPSLVEFRTNPETNRIVPGVTYNGPFTMLDPIRFRYVSKDPDVYQPGGRSPFLAVLDTVFFYQQFMRDLQAVVHQNNVPRLDIKVLTETVAVTINSLYPHLNLPGQETARQIFIDGYLADLQNTINNLQADDAFIHWDNVETNYINPTGTAIPVPAIVAALDAQIVAATKQLPLLLGRNEGATTTHATVQWQVYVLKLSDYQRIANTLATWALNLYLRIQGRQSYAVLEYEKHKTSDEYLDAQTLNLKAVTWEIFVDRGWGDDDEAAQDLLGHDAVGKDTPETQVVDSPDAGDVVEVPKPTHVSNARIRHDPHPVVAETIRTAKGKPLSGTDAKQVDAFTREEIDSLLEAWKKLPRKPK